MYDLFKGYIPLKNKRALIPFKNKSADELFDYEQAQKYDEFAGILNDNTVLIDIDNKEQADILDSIVDELNLNCRVYQTKRGKHFLFLNNGQISKNGNGKALACGLKSDIKIGAHNSYSVLKQDGAEREILYDIDSDEEYQTLPKWLLPVKADYGFITMSNGDGRNQAMFNYILALQSEGFTKDEIRETLRIINDYVMKEPLKKKELETILRDDSFKKPVFMEKNKFLHDKFGDYLINEHRLKKINGVIHKFQNGVYVPADIENLTIQYIPGLTQRQRKEVVSYITHKQIENKRLSDANYIAFKNGVYNLKTHVLEDFDDELILTNQIPWNYSKNAYNELGDELLNNLVCNDKPTRLLLEEMIGYTFFRRNELRKAFMLKGTRRNGKSTFVDMLKWLLGESNYSSLDLSDFNHEYKLAELNGKLANLGDDVEDDYIPSAGKFKKIVSGETLTSNVKYFDPIQFNPYCKLIFTGNTIPRLGKGRDSAAILDRLIIVPFNNYFSGENGGTWIKYDLRKPEVMEYMVRVGIEGLERVLKNNGFTTTNEIANELNEYAETINPILLFFAEIGDDMLDKPTKWGFNQYEQFCIDNRLKAVSHIEFSKQVKEQLKYKIKDVRIDGKVRKVFKR